MFGKAILCRLIRENAHKGSLAIQEAVTHALTEFRGDTHLADDVTMVVIKVEDTL
jgi:serine phosphatase RsbU (regulator of sigma subunit)